jgi:hypothetical protein
VAVPRRFIVADQRALQDPGEWWRLHRARDIRAMPLYLQDESRFTGAGRDDHTTVGVGMFSPQLRNGLTALDLPHSFVP